MIKAFDIVGTDVTFKPEFLAVPEFKAIWDRDKSKNKNKAIQELSYIVFLCDSRIENPYSSYPETTRKEILNIDFFDSETYTPDDLIKDGINKLSGMLDTTTTRLLKGAQVAADQLSEWFKNIDFNKTDASGKLIYSASELARNLSAVGNIVKSLKQLEKQVRQEQLDDNTARGGSEIGDFEIPDFEVDNKD